MKPSQPRITFGSHNLPSDKNEDRGSMLISHEADGCPQISSFGVFDGHNGSMAASICSHVFNRSVVRRFLKMSTATVSDGKNVFSDLSKQDKADALFCESLRLAAIEVDSNIRTSHHAGCTLNTLFFVQHPEYAVTRVYCANIGDSRSVMFTPNGDLRSSINEFNFEKDLSEHDTLSSSVHSKIVRTKTIALQCSEDHKLALSRERKRVEMKQDVVFVPLPSDIVVCNLMSNTPDSSQELSPTELRNSIFSMGAAEDRMNESGFLEYGYPPAEVMEQATRYVQAVTSQVDVLPKAITYKVSESVEMVGALDGTGFYSNAEGGKSYGEPTIVHQESFTMQRATSAGALGPEAIMGRFNLSINMTRSIGDKYGPRCVVPIPEISVVNISDETFARFVTASDGVWDVMNNDDVKKFAFRYASPEMAAMQIADEAQRLRFTSRKHMDDISVIVIDINAHLFPDTAGCGSCIII